MHFHSHEQITKRKRKEQKSEENIHLEDVSEISHTKILAKLLVNCHPKSISQDQMHENTTVFGQIKKRSSLLKIVEVNESIFGMREILHKMRRTPREHPMLSEQEAYLIFSGE